MAEEPKKDQPEDISSILSDLDAILTDLGGDAKAAPPPPVPPPSVELPKAKPVEPPNPVEPPKPVEAVKLPPPPPPPAPPAPPPPPAPRPPTIELAPREGMIRPPEKPVEPPKPAPAPPPAPKPVPAPAPAPAPAAAAPAAGAPPPAGPPPAELPADAPKEQIRRVAYVFTSSSSEVKTAFATFLSQAARTISKKPLFLREVLAQEVGAASDPNSVLQKALQQKAVAVLAIVESWPMAKIDELSEACSRANVLFRSVAAADAQKKSMAVDIIVDMMLLPGEG